MTQAPETDSQPENTRTARGVGATVREVGSWSMANVANGPVLLASVLHTDKNRSAAPDTNNAASAVKASHVTGDAWPPVHALSGRRDARSSSVTSALATAKTEPSGDTQTRCCTCSNCDQVLHQTNAPTTAHDTGVRHTRWEHPTPGGLVSYWTMSPVSRFHSITSLSSPHEYKSGADG